MMMSPEEIQEAKNNFANSLQPPIQPCTNTNCKFTGCTCGNTCGCHIPPDELPDNLQHCDPCAEFKMKKKLEMEEKNQNS
mmetsp:Transcript_28341/g.42856  ORF Transcript_28341/g.42856 Transcript_28341/m.42856 type:complete len:80 (+) Transcript_28341:204-443(+)